MISSISLTRVTFEWIFSRFSVSSGLVVRNSEYRRSLSKALMIFHASDW